MSAVCTRCGVILHGLDKDGVVCEDCRKAEAIDHPAHYTAGKVECIDAIEAATVGLEGIQAVCTGNVIKYIWRWKRKGGVQDLYKCRWYLDRLIEVARKALASTPTEPSGEEREGDLIGYWINEKCPKCGADMLVNKVGDKWCSMVGCDYSINAPEGEGNE